MANFVEHTCGSNRCEHAATRAGECVSGVANTNEADVRLIKTHCAQRRTHVRNGVLAAAPPSRAGGAALPIDVLSAGVAPN